MLNRFIINFLFLLFSSLLVGQENRATMKSGPIDYMDTLPQYQLCAMPTLTREFTKAHLEKMKRDYPETYRRMQLPPILTKTANVGSFDKKDKLPFQHIIVEILGKISNPDYVFVIL